MTESAFMGTLRITALLAYGLQIRFLVELGPVAVESFYEFEQTVESDRFNQIGVRAQFIGAINIRRLLRGSEDDNRQAFEAIVSAAKPGQHLQAAAAGQLQIEQNKGRDRKFL